MKMAKMVEKVQGMSKRVVIRSVPCSWDPNQKKDIRLEFWLLRFPTLRKLRKIRSSRICNKIKKPSREQFFKLKLKFFRFHAT